MNDASTEIAVCFTDGSSRGNPGNGGWASVLACGTQVIERGGREDSTTNNKMELLAIVRGMECALQMGAKKICIATDSSYALKGSTLWIHGWKKNGWKTKLGDEVANQDVWQLIDDLLQKIDASFVLVAGHVGTPGNERCDTIATAYADQKNIELYEGALCDYDVSIVKEGKPVISRSEGLVAKKKKKSGSTGQAYSYVSMVDGDIQTHATWAECERRVKGVKNTRFKKSMNADDEAEIISQFRTGKK